MEEFLATDPARLVFLDETGANTAMDRTYGRAASGKPVDGPVPQGHWQVTTLTAAVRLDGVIEPACMASNQATTAEYFKDYVARCLVPTLRMGDIVIMDNLSSHKSAEVERLIVAAGAELRFLPAYSPDLNPIEALFSKLKEFLRSAKARTFDAMLAALDEGLKKVHLSDIVGWFAKSGYRA